VAILSSIELIGLRYWRRFLKERQPEAIASMITTEHAIMKIAKTQMLQFGNNPTIAFGREFSISIHDLMPLDGKHSLQASNNRLRIFGQISS
jgi:hypothetical protein